MLEWQGEGYYIRSSGSGKYLTIEGNARDGLPVIGAHHPTLWDIRPDEEDGSVHRSVAVHSSLRSLDHLLTLHLPARIFLHGTPFNIDLTDYGNPTPGTVRTFRDLTIL